MANEKENAPAKNEVDAMAFEIFKDRVAGGMKRQPEQEAILAFKLAEAFVRTRNSIARGDVKTSEPEGIRLAEVSCPNQKRTHPINLVSQRYGNLDRAQKINAWLAKHPTPESEPEELVHSLNKEFPDLSWDLPQINTARAVLPAYAAK